MAPKSAAKGTAGAIDAKARLPNVPIATCGRSSLGAGKLRAPRKPGMKLMRPSRSKRPRVIGAANLLGVAGGRHEQIAAMGADVGQAAQHSGRVAHQQQGLVEQAGQHLARRQRPGRGQVRQIADPLPTAHEKALACQRIERLVQIERLVEGRGDADVGIDAEPCGHDQIIACARRARRLLWRNRTLGPR